MPKPPMSAPVTHAELREELVALESRVDQTFELWAGAILDRMDKRFAAVDQRFAAMEQRFAAMEQRWSVDLARHTGAIAEALARAVAAVDEKYTDLPPRVARLERTVFKRTRKR